MTPQPLRHVLFRYSVPAGVLDGQLSQQRLGQWVILADRHEAKFFHRRHAHHLNV
jgi:hypothetical protein